MTLMQRSPDPTPVPPLGEPDGRTSVPGASRLHVVPRLSAAERQRREDAVRFADASIRLEGFKVSPQAQARAERFVAGEIDLAEFLSGK